MSDMAPYRIVLWGLRHPLKALGLLLVAGIGLAISSEVDWAASITQVRTGRTADAHKLAEGIDEHE